MSGACDRLADLEVLRRVERLAVAWGVGGAIAYGLTRSWAGAGVLTGVAAASIVAFRGLQRIVSALGPAGNGSGAPLGIGKVAPVPTDEPAGGSRATGSAEEGQGGNAIGWRAGLGALVRLCLLGAIVGAGSFLLDPEYFPAIVLGFSTLPAAFMTEGALQAARALRGRDHDDVS